MNDIYLNTILYGVAGTGKTYNSIIYAVAIVENQSIEEISKIEYSEVIKRFKEYQSKKLIETITFHQAYSYEDFIEGIKPTLNTKEVSYTLEDGIFKKFCNDYSTLDFLIGQDISSRNAKHYIYIIDGISNENIIIKKFKLGSNQDGKIVSIPIELVLKLVQSIKNNELTIMDLKNSNDFENTSLNYDTSLLKSYKDILLNIVEKILLNNSLKLNQNRVFIIDEINRGNISSIFGELITLIEPSKRMGNLEELKIRLPYSKQSFGIPNNIYILGTMNSTDHSTITIDTALRRRFHFIKMQPNYKIFQDISIEGVEVSKMFSNINLRIEYLIGKDYLIGHTYFLNLLDSPTLDTLAEIFEYTIIPLLEEYFYNDYEKIRLVLADNQTDIEENQFILEKSTSLELFNSLDLDFNPIYKVNKIAFHNIESYKKI